MFRNTLRMLMKLLTQTTLTSKQLKGCVIQGTVLLEEILVTMSMSTVFLKAFISALVCKAVGVEILRMAFGFD